MNQEIKNENEIGSQLIAQKIDGNVYLSKKSRFSKRFERLNQEVASDDRYEGTLEELKYYLTKLDGVDTSTKLKDGGFDKREIENAEKRKERCWKKLEKHKFYESAQWINTQLFAKIKMDFEQYVERPLIKKGASKDQILDALVLKVVNPILELLNDEGEQDDVLNYTSEDIYGMIYFLTGKCHINWKDYDNI